MSNKTKIVLLGVLAALILLPSFVQTGGARAVYLKAMFRDFGTDRIMSDGKGLYQNASNITVQFTETGDLQFIIGDRASRRVNFLFGWDNRLGDGLCGACQGETWPDTSCTDPALPDEPITYFSFLTIDNPSYRGPKVNFLNMLPGDIAPVRLRVYFETKTRKYFRLRYYNSLDPDFFDPTVTCVVGGPVMVKAIDLNGDMTVDRWVLYTVPDTNDRALFFKDYARRGNDWMQCSFGFFSMPFELTLDRK
jgi:hypothetical protein